MKLSEKEVQVLRDKYNIPTCFDYACSFDGKHVFTFCDHDITIRSDGSATETWMGLNSSATGHAFITTPYVPGERIVRGVKVGA